MEQTNFTTSKYETKSSIKKLLSQSVSTKREQGKPLLFKLILRSRFTLTSSILLLSRATGRNGKAGIQNRKQSRKRNRNRNPNLRNKNWRRFCLESVTNNNCSIKTFHPHIIFIYCYYIFYCRIFCVRRKIFLREFHLSVSVATWDHD